MHRISHENENSMSDSEVLNEIIPKLRGEEGGQFLNIYEH